MKKTNPLWLILTLVMTTIGGFILYSYLDSKYDPLLTDKVTTEKYLEQLGIDESAEYQEMMKAGTYLVDTYEGKEGNYIINEKNTFLWDEDFDATVGDKVLYIKNDRNEMSDYYTVKNVVSIDLSEEGLNDLISKSINKDIIKHLTIGGEYITLTESQGKEIRKDLISREIDKDYFVRIGNNKVYPKPNSFSVRYFELNSAYFMDYIVIGQYYTLEEKETLESFKNQLGSINDSSIAEQLKATYQKNHPSLFPTAK